MHEPTPLIRVLLVDDEPDQLQVAELSLRGHGFEVATALSAMDALNTIRGSAFDCIVSDYKMPGMNGLELCERLSEEGVTIPFILFTGHGSEELAEKAFNLGVDTYLRKERYLVVFALLEQSIRSLVEKNRTEKRLRESEGKLRNLFSNMLDGYAYCKMIYDQDGKPIDFSYLEVNESFERLTGLKREHVLGRCVSKVIPGTREANPEVIDTYGRVSSSGAPEKLEIFFKPLGIWLSISVYSPEKGYFVAVFDNITERKRAEEELRKANEALQAASEELQKLKIGS